MILAMPRLAATNGLGTYTVLLSRRLLSVVLYRSLALPRLFQLSRWLYLLARPHRGLCHYHASQASHFIDPLLDQTSFSCLFVTAVSGPTTTSNNWSRFIKRSARFDLLIFQRAYDCDLDKSVVDPRLLSFSSSIHRHLSLVLLISNPYSPATHSFTTCRRPWLRPSKMPKH